MPSAILDARVLRSSSTPKTRTLSGITLLRVHVLGCGGEKPHPEEGVCAADSLAAGERRSRFSGHSLSTTAVPVSRQSLRVV